MLTRYTAYLLENIFEPFVLALDAADNLGGDVLRGFKGLPDCSKNPVLQHIQASIFHYNTIGPHVVSIEIWPSTDSMYFEHYLCVGSHTNYVENSNKPEGGGFVWPSNFSHIHPHPTLCQRLALGILALVS